MQSWAMIGLAIFVWWGQISGFSTDFGSRPYDTPAKYGLKKI